LYNILIIKFLSLGTDVRSASWKLWLCWRRVYWCSHSEGGSQYETTS